jgi:hypothetical protein
VNLLPTRALLQHSRVIEYESRLRDAVIACNSLRPRSR